MVGQTSQPGSHGSAACHAELPKDLLLIIFESLECRDLHRCLRVCKHWKSLIANGTPAIRQAMFLDSKEAISAKPLKVTTNIETIALPLPTNTIELPRPKDTSSGQRLCYDARLSCESCDPLDTLQTAFAKQLHPVLQDVTRNIDIVDLRFSPDPDKPHIMCARNLTCEPAQERSTLFETLVFSLNKAHVAMPPVREVTLLVDMHCHPGGSRAWDTSFTGYARRTVKDPNGVKVGAVLRVLQEELVESWAHLEDSRTKTRRIFGTRRVAC